MLISNELDSPLLLRSPVTIVVDVSLQIARTVLIRSLPLGTDTVHSPQSLTVSSIISDTDPNNELIN